MMESIRGIYKRDRNSPQEGQVTLDDDTEKTLIDIGDADGVEATRLQTILLDISLNSHSSITIRLKADVNGSFQSITSNQYSSGQVTAVFGDVNPDRLTGRRVAITAEGSDADPTTAGTVDYSVEYSTAGYR